MAKLTLKQTKNEQIIVCFFFFLTLSNNYGNTLATTAIKFIWEKTFCRMDGLLAIIETPPKNTKSFAEVC